MGVSDILSRKSGVVVYVSASSSSPMQTAADDICSGDDVRKLFKYCQEKNFAIPAINVTSSISVVATLEAARDAKSPIILQMSQGGAVSR